MNTTQSRTKTMVGAAVGVGILAGAAGLIFYTLEQRKKLKDFRQDIDRLDILLSELQQDLLALRRSERSSIRRTSTKSANTKDEKTGQDFEKKIVTKDSEDKFDGNDSDEMQSAAEDLDEISAAEDSDDVFYDCCSSEEEISRLKYGGGVAKASKQSESRHNRRLFQQVDILFKGGDEERLEAFELLKKEESNLSNSSEFLWRYAEAHQIQASACVPKKNDKEKKEFVFKGLKYASKALNLDPTSSNVNKWFAILIGMSGEFSPLNQKIEGARLFYEHVNEAMRMNPKDYSLHHLLGRFKFEVAKTSWIERELASKLFGNFPNFTYGQALPHMLEAEALSPRPWKENRLLLAKCYVAMKNHSEAVHWLQSVLEVPPRTKEDKYFDAEAETMLKKYQK